MTEQDIVKKLDDLLEKIETFSSNSGAQGAGLTELLFDWSKRFSEMQNEILHVSEKTSEIENRVMLIQKKIVEIIAHVDRRSGGDPSKS